MASKIPKIEKKYGMPLKRVILSLYEKHGNIYKVAHELGVTQSTVSLWAIREQLEFRQVLVEKKEVE